MKKNKIYYLYFILLIFIDFFQKLQLKTKK
jgi:hypothetical protein